MRASRFRRAEVDACASPPVRALRPCLLSSAPAGGVARARYGATGAASPRSCRRGACCPTPSGAGAIARSRCCSGCTSPGAPDVRRRARLHRPALRRGDGARHLPGDRGQHPAARARAALGGGRARARLVLGAAHPLLGGPERGALPLLRRRLAADPLPGLAAVPHRDRLRRRPPRRPRLGAAARAVPRRCGGGPAVDLAVHPRRVHPCRLGRQHRVLAGDEQLWRDPLTGLAGRAIMFDRLRLGLRRAHRKGLHAGVIFPASTASRSPTTRSATPPATLSSSRRARACARRRAPTTPSGRFGGHEFVSVCEDLRDVHEAVVVAERLSAALREPYGVEGQEIVLTVSAGSPSAGVTTSAAPRTSSATPTPRCTAPRRTARTAMSSSARTCTSVRSRALADEVDIRRALPRGALRVRCEPQFALATGRVRALEARVHWHHPTRGLLERRDFEAVAAETGMIVPIGEWAIAEACRQPRRAGAARRDRPDRRLAAAPARAAARRRRQRLSTPAVRTAPARRRPSGDRRAGPAAASAVPRSPRGAARGTAAG